MATPYNVTVKFLDGPMAKEQITVGEPAPHHLKIGMPEWCVYRLTADGYAAWLTGEMAKLWRDPDRPGF